MCAMFVSIGLSLLFLCQFLFPVCSDVTKPLCTDLKKYPNMQNGAFITRDPGHWRYRMDGSREYTVDTCRLKRFTSEEAKSCLAGHHVVFIGDSVTRYQFLSLVYFIEHGRWPYRFDIPETNRTQVRKCLHIDRFGKETCQPWGAVGNVASEKGWGHVHGHEPEESWKKMHIFIGGSGFNGRLECQCVRDEVETSTEDMFYERGGIVNPVKSPNFIDNPTISENRIPRDPDIAKISFLNDLSLVPMHAWRRSHCSRTSSCNLTESDWYDLRSKARNMTWDYNQFATNRNFASDFLQKVVPDVDIALFNRGLWAGWPMDIKESTSVFQSLYQLATIQNAGTCYWKGTTPSRAGGMSEFDLYPHTFARREAEVRHNAYVEGCGVYDVSHVTQQFASMHWEGDVGRRSIFPDKIPNDYGEREHKNVYMDASHFEPWVSEELNQVLLNVLC